MGYPRIEPLDRRGRRRACEELAAAGFGPDVAVPILLEPGDVLLHDILVLHGSPACTSGLRRVLYYEFRPIDLELRVGPHTPSYVPRKQQVLLACLADRAEAKWSRGETPYVYRPSPEHAPPPLAPGARLETYRVPHHEHWRWE